MPPHEPHDWLDLVAKVLLRCFILGCMLLLVWAGLFLLAGDFMFQLHRQLFGLTQHEMALIHYCGIALVKVLVLLFFLFPYIAIRLVLRKQRRSHLTS